jgi:hypothetical protein
MDGGVGTNDSRVDDFCLVPVVEFLLSGNN